MKLRLKNDYLTSVKEKKETEENIKIMDQRNYTESCKESYKRMKKVIIELIQEEIKNYNRQTNLKNEFIYENNRLLEEKRKILEKEEIIRHKDKEIYNQRMRIRNENEEKQKHELIV